MGDTSYHSVPLRIIIGVFLVSMTSLLFEVSLSRILAITLWHHFAFLVISCALLGYGAAGVWLYLFRIPRYPFIPALLLSVFLYPLVITSNRIPFDPALLTLNPFQVIYLLIMFVILALPFFFVGLTLTLVLRRYPTFSFRIYSVDLLGAAAGCLGFFVVVMIGGESVWLVIMTFFSSLAALFFCHSRKNFWFPILPPVVLISLILCNRLPQPVMSDYKSLSLALKSPNAAHFMTRWDAISRVDWFESPLARFAPGLSLNYRGTLPVQTGISIDGDRVTAYSQISQKDRDFLNHLPSGFLFRVDPRPSRVLVLDSVSGHEFYQGFLADVSEITVQTEFPLLAEWLTEKIGGKQVRFITTTARAYLESERNRFDRIIVSLEGALPTGGTGMSSLRKSTLETEEGMLSLLERLEDNGWLSFHRYLIPPPRAELRLVATLAEVMRKKGWNPEKQLGLFRTVSTIMILVHAKPWTKEQIDQFVTFCESRMYTPVFFPGMKLEEANRSNQYAQPIYATAVNQILTDSEFINRYLFDIRPVTDDSPYFWHFLKIKSLHSVYTIFDGKWEALVEAGLLLPLLWLFVVFCALFFLVLPFAFRADSVFRPFSVPVCFLSLGFGFMLVEIAFFEQMTLFLGYPSYSFAILLGTILTSTGLGAGLTSRIGESKKRIAHPLLIVILLVYFGMLSPVLDQLAGLSLPYRIAVSVGFISVPGFLMGIPFPGLEYSLICFWIWCKSLYTRWKRNSHQETGIRYKAN